MSFELGDYNDVASRIQEFRTKHPDGSLQPADPEHPYRIETIGEKAFIVVVAAAYRSPDDERPGIGMAMEPFPGATPYTRGSELQNAETSAWGRALIAAGAADARKGVASLEEVQARRQPNRRSSTKDTSRSGEREVELIRPSQRTAIQAGFTELGLGGDENRGTRLTVAAKLAGLEKLGSTNDLTAAQAKKVLDGIAAKKRESKAAQNGHSEGDSA